MIEPAKRLMFVSLPTFSVRDFSSALAISSSESVEMCLYPSGSGAPRPRLLSDLPPLHIRMHTDVGEGRGGGGGLSGGNDGILAKGGSIACLPYRADAFPAAPAPTFRLLAALLAVPAGKSTQP